MVCYTKLIMDKLPPEEFYALLPKKRTAALVFYPCAHNTVLIVEPNYRPEWLLPGGSVEKDESLLAAAKRESIEEIGFEKVTNQLLVVNYIKTIGYKSETIHFVFKGENLIEEDMQRIKLEENELKSFRCATLEEAEKIVSKALRLMLPYAFKALETGSTEYIEGETEIL